MFFLILSSVNKINRKGLFLDYFDRRFFRDFQKKKKKVKKKILLIRKNASKN